VDHRRADDPTTGACLLDGRPTHEQVGAVALSFQAARLPIDAQPRRSGSSLRTGFSHRDKERVTAALGVVGLDPALGKRRIDQLSGGQMRRVVLAGLLACSPPGVDPRRAAGRAWMPPASAGCCGCWRTCAADRGLTVVVISLTSPAWKTCARAFCICTMVCWNRSRSGDEGRRVACHDIDVRSGTLRIPAPSRPIRVADSGTRQLDHPRFVGRHQTVTVILSKTSARL